MCYERVSMEEGCAKQKNMIQFATFYNECPEKP